MLAEAGREPEESRTVLGFPALPWRWATIGAFAAKDINFIFDG